MEREGSVSIHQLCVCCRFALRKTVPSGGNPRHPSSPQSLQQWGMAFHACPCSGGGSRCHGMDRRGASAPSPPPWTALIGAALLRATWDESNLWGFALPLLNEEKWEGGKMGKRAKQKRGSLWYAKIFQGDANEAISPLRHSSVHHYTSFQPGITVSDHT